MNAARFPPASRERVPPADAPPPRASPPILERFRVMLRDREEELRADDPRPLVSEDVVPLYEDVLSELVFNSKPIITELTIIAGEQREHAAGIADAVCSRILDVPIDQKLPCLYLLDSIVKNIGNEYLRCFSDRLPEVFCEAYYQVPSNIRASMRHLFGTWSTVFSSSVRRQIHNALQFSSPESRQSSSSGNIRNSESLSPRPAHGIHVNPKYLEARHRFDQSDNQWERDPHIRTNESDFENDLLEIKAAEIPKKWPGGSSNYHDARQSRESFPVLESHGHKTLPIEDYKLDRPDAIGKSDGGVAPKVAVHHGSLSHSKINHVRHSSPEVSFNRVGGRNSWQEKNLLGVNPQQTEVHMSYDFTNELSAIRSRELIDAYGNSEGKSALYVKPSKIQRLDNNGINAESAAKNWQSYEEEEYVWEDMSPTLASRCSRSMPNDVNFRKPVAGVHLKKPDASILDSDFKSNWSVHAQFLPDGSSSVLGTDRASISEFATETVHRGSQISVVQHSTSNFGHESWKSRYMSQQSSKLNLSPRSHGDILHPSVSRSDVAAVSHLPSSSVPSEANTLFVAAVSHLPPSSASTGADSVFGPSGTMKVDKCPPVSSTVATEKLLGQRLPSSNIIPSTTWPSVNKSHPFSSIFVSSQSSQFTERLNTNTSKPMNKGIDLPFSLSWNPSDTFDKRRSNAGMVISAPFQDASIVSINADNQSSIPPQFPNQDLQGSIIVPVETQIPYPTGYLSSQAQPIFPSSVGYLNQFPLQSSFLAPRIPQNSFQMHGGPLPPLPPGPPPTMPQPESFGNNSSSTMLNTPPSAFSGLLNSLVSKGLISLTPQDNIGIEFNPDNLKIRHESAINDLYANLPRQCTTCGLRFKCQEEHSSHMDWHVTKNRMSKNHKQKSSRKWFVTSKEWLSGAETVGVDAVPGFLPMEAVVDNHEEKELAVPADDNQKLCALCGEPFEDFYSDEADEWMYKGAVYLNAPEGYIGGMDRFQFGPIVHAKCRSESTEVQGSA